MADALHDVFTGRRPFDQAMARYQRQRDEAALPKYDLTCQFANLEDPPPPESRGSLAAMVGNQEAMSDFLSTLAGIIPPPEFFAAENVARIMARRSGRRGASGNG